MIFKYLYNLKDWFFQNYDWIISTIIQSITAIILFLLSIKLTKKARLEHKNKIKQEAKKLKLGKKIFLVNIKRYFKDYPSNKERLFTGYSHIKGEIKTTRFDGIEFFCGIKEVYRQPNKKLSINEKHKDKAIEKFKVYEVGVVPYEWVEYLDLQGDEYGHIPLLFCHYKGPRFWKESIKRHLPFGYPYKKLIYYRESDVYHESSDPIDMKYRYVNEPISKK